MSNYAGYLPLTASVAIAKADKVKNIKLTIDPSLDAIPGYAWRPAAPTQTFDANDDSERLDGDEQHRAGGWEFDDPKPRGNLTGGSGGFATVDSDYVGIGKTEDTYLTSPVFDLSAAASPMVTFDTYYRPLSSTAGGPDCPRTAAATWSDIWTGPDGHRPAATSRSACRPRRKTRRSRSVSTTSAPGPGTGRSTTSSSAPMTFKPVHGGLVAGVVTDANTGTGVNGATVTSDTDATREYDPPAPVIRRSATVSTGSSVR